MGIGEEAEGQQCKWITSRRVMWVVMKPIKEPILEEALDVDHL